MSVEQFCFRLGKSQIHPNDKKWMPPWLEEYAKGLGSGQAVALPVTEEGVLAFLRSLRDRGVPAWQRLQAARSVEWYQELVLQRREVDFGGFKRKLGELAEVEKRTGGSGSTGDGIAGEGLPSLIDPKEPAAVRLLRERMRVLHHPRSTETAYVGWLARFIRHLDDEHVDNFGEVEIGQFLTELAVTGEVTAEAAKGPL